MAKRESVVIDGVFTEVPVKGILTDVVGYREVL